MWLLGEGEVVAVGLFWDLRLVEKKSVILVWKVFSVGWVVVGGAVTVAVVVVE